MSAVSTTSKPPTTTFRTTTSSRTVTNILGTRPAWLVPEDLSHLFGSLTRSTVETAESKLSTGESSALFFTASTTETSTGITSNSKAHITDERPKVQEKSKNCTGERSENPTVVISTKDVANGAVIQLNISNAHVADQKDGSFFHFQTLFGQLGRILNFWPQARDESSIMCKAAGNSTLLKSLFCPTRTDSSDKRRHFSKLINYAERLAPAILANLTEAMNLTDEESDEEISDLSDETEQSNSFSLSDNSTSSFWMYFSKFFNYENGSTTSFTANFSAHPLTTTLSNVSVVPETAINIRSEAPTNSGSSMINPSDLLSRTHSSHVISAVNSLNRSVVEELLDSILNNSSVHDELFNKSRGKEIAMSTIKVTPTPTPTTAEHTEPNVLHKNFWKTDRKHPIKGLQRIAGPRLQKIPSIGRRWRTMSPSSSIFRPRAQMAGSSKIIRPSISTH